MNHPPASLPFRLLAAAMAAVMLFTTCSYRRPVALPTDSRGGPPALTEKDIGKDVVVVRLDGGSVKGELLDYDKVTLTLFDKKSATRAQIPWIEIERIGITERDPIGTGLLTAAILTPIAFMIILAVAWRNADWSE